MNIKTPYKSNAFDRLVRALSQPVPAPTGMGWVLIFEMLVLTGIALWLAYKYL